MFIRTCMLIEFYQKFHYAWLFGPACLLGTGEYYYLILSLFPIQKYIHMCLLLDLLTFTFAAPKVWSLVVPLWKSLTSLYLKPFGLGYSRTSRVWHRLLKIFLFNDKSLSYFFCKIVSEKYYSSYISFQLVLKCGM